MIGVVVDRQSHLVIALVHEVVSSSTVEIVGSFAAIRGVDPDLAEVLLFEDLNIEVGKVLPEGLIPVAPPLSDVEQLRMENADLTLRLADVELALADVFAAGGGA
ncbi:hypothetical protein D3C81_1117460 [compost metagenome]